MATINEVISILDSKLLEVDDENSRIKLKVIKKELISIKHAPEISASCQIDFKLSNSHEYLERIEDA